MPHVARALLPPAHPGPPLHCANLPLSQVPLNIAKRELQAYIATLREQVRPPLTAALLARPRPSQVPMHTTTRPALPNSPTAPSWSR